jgi:hypothetical protein
MYTHLPIRKMCVRKKIRKILNPREIHDFILKLSRFIIACILDMCKSDPNPIRSDSFGFRNKNIHFGSDRIDKVVS